VDGFVHRRIMTPEELEVAAGWGFARL
jgi:hypothetical protein